MSNINNAQISGRIITPFNYIDEQNASLTAETLSIIGTSAMGPAFVPQQVLSFNKTDSVLNTWENIFGEFQYQQDQIGPLTANIWLSNNGQQLTYTRVLGIGNGEGLNNDGHYENAGFIVGDQPLSGSINDGVKGPNKFSVQGGNPGRTHFFGSYFENLDLEGYVSPHNDYIEQIGFANEDKIGLITDVVFATDGTVFHLQDEELDDIKQDKLYEELSTINSSQSINFGNKESTLENPKIYLQGQLNNAKNVLDYYDNSNKYLKTNYYENLFNTTPDYHLNAGHLHYASFRNTSPVKKSKRDNDDVKHFVCVGDNLWNQEVNAGSDARVNYESFESIYTKAKTPWIVSQPVYREENFRQNLQNSCKKLFRFHAYSDGKKGNKYRFRILPRRLGDINKTDMSEMWSKFDLIVYKYDYKNNSFNDLMTFKDLNLNPKSEDYIGKKVGTEREYYDLSLKKVCHVGDYKKTNNHIYVELSDDVEYMNNESDLMPSGFFPYPHMNISNDYLSITDTIPVIQNPIQFVSNMKITSVNDNVINYDLNNTHWGIEFSKQDLVEIKDVSLVNSDELLDFKFNRVKESLPEEYNFYHNYTKFFQNHRDEKFWLTPFEDYESDPFNNFFHLEKILYLPLEDTNKEKWNYSFYRRDGKPVGDIDSVPDIFEYINIDEVLKSDSEADARSSVYLSFDFFTYGGFDGLNILDENKRKMNSISCLREYEGEIAGKSKGQTSYAYEVAKNIALDNDNFRCDIFTIPDINIPDMTKELVDKSKEDSSFIYLFDCLDYDEDNDLIKDNYYFNNLDNNILDILDENNTIKSKIISGTDNSIQNHFLNYYSSEYSLSTINKCEAIVDDTLIVVPSSTVFINSLSQSSLLEPIDSINYTNNILTIVNPINSKFIYNTNDFDKLLLETKKKDNKVNPIGVLSAGKKIKPLSANTLSDKRKSIFSLFHNVRIYLDIKRNLKDLLVTQPIVNGETALFSLYSERNIFSNTKPQIQTEIINLLQGYVDRNEIKSYFVDLSLLATEKSKNEKLDNVISGSVGISFNGDNKNENFFESINLNNLLNDISDFTAQNNINIININN